MSKVIDALWVTAASMAKHGFNHEGNILRDVFFHSVLRACFVGSDLTMPTYVRSLVLRVVL